MQRRRRFCFVVAAAVVAAVFGSRGATSPAAAQAPAVRSAAPTAGLPGSVVPSGWGVNIHFTDPQPGEMTRFAEAGYGLARMDLFWNAVEKTRGVYDFSAYDRLVNSLASAGARPLFILDYGNDLYQTGAPRSPEAVAAFARFAGAAAAHFKGKNVIWEIWNEPNLGQFWQPKPDANEYATLALATAKAVRAADPGATLIGPGASGFPWKFLETVFKRGLLAHLDAVSVHPYRGQNPETAADDFARLRVLIARHAPEGKRELPIASSEWGYSTFTGGGISENQQAQYLVRQWLSNLAAGVNTSIFYDWKDDGDNPAENEHRFGTVRRNFDAKPSFLAAKRLIADLRGFSFRHRLAGKDSNDWRLLFQRGDTDDLALVTWTTDEKTLELARMPAVRKIKPGAADFRDLRRLASVRWAYGTRAAGAGQNARIAVSVANFEKTQATAWIRFGPDGETALVIAPTPGWEGKLTATLPLGWLRTDPPPVPVEVRWNRERLPALAPLMVRRVDPLNVSAAPDGRGTLHVNVENPAGTAFEGRIVLHTDKGEVSRPLVLAKEKTHADVMLPSPGNAEHQILLRDARNVEVALLNRRRFLPLTGFIGTPKTLTGFGQVLFIENVAQKPTPLSVVETPPGSPARFAFALRYQFDKGWRYVQATSNEPLPIPAHASALLVWVHANGSGDALRARFRDAGGQTFQPDLGQLTWSGWRLVTIPLDGSGSGGHWGGANDGVPHGALTWDALILVDSANRELAHGGQLLLAAPVYVMESKK